jgi:hypothetical protein
VLKTLVGAADPGLGPNAPVVMIVNSTPWQRAVWMEACSDSAVRHHFCGPYSASRRLRDGFRPAAIVIDHDLSGEFPSPPTGDHSVAAFLRTLVETSYSGPLIGTNLEGRPNEAKAIKAAAAQVNSRTIILDEHGMFTYDTILWSLFH